MMEPVLSELHIENLGVIDTVDLVLGDGLTAITGETGAGKTMLVEALGTRRRWARRSDDRAARGSRGAHRRPVRQ